MANVPNPACSVGEEDKRQILSLLLPCERYLELAREAGVEHFTKTHRQYMEYWKDGATRPDNARETLYAGSDLGSAAIRLNTIWEILHDADIKTTAYDKSYFFRYVRHNTAHPDVLGEASKLANASDQHKRIQEYLPILDTTPANLYKCLRDVCSILRTELHGLFAHGIPT